MSINKRVTFLCERKQHSFVVNMNVKKYTQIYKECGIGLCIGARKEDYVTNKIVRMEALIVLGEFSLIK